MFTTPGTLTAPTPLAAAAPAPLQLPFKAIRPSGLVSVGVLGTVAACAVLSAVRPKSAPPVVMVVADGITGTVVAAHPVEAVLVGWYYRRKGFGKATQRKAAADRPHHGIFGSWSTSRRPQSHPPPLTPTTPPAAPAQGRPRRPRPG